jgi:tyrosyl-tRNA synthetase
MATPKTPKSDLIQSVITRNVEQVIEPENLKKALQGGKKLRVKLGIDPTGDKIHIGRAVQLWKLREFQELGHKAVLIIGDFTAQIGDASDKLKKRPFLTKAEVKKNLKNYLPQIGKIVDLEKAEVRFNSEWLAKLTFREISELADIFSVQQMVERRNFKERWERHEEISMREFMYPLMQGYDSVAVKADVELGGTDQLFNLTAGRKIQVHFGQKPQDIMTMGMLLGTDGRKMSTSWGNVINIIDPADEQFGKVMTVLDSEILNYYRFATRISDEDIRAIDMGLIAGKNPRDAKLHLAREIVTLYHGAKAAEQAAAKWTQLFTKKETATDLAELRLRNKHLTAAELVVETKVMPSKSEAWRLVQQGGLKVNERAHTDPKEGLTLKAGDVVKVGKRHFFRVI